MTPTDTAPTLHTFFSLKPLVQVLRRMVAEGQPGAERLYAPLLAEVDAFPALQSAIEDEALLEQHRELVYTLLSTIFPPSGAAQQGMYAVSIPFVPGVVFASPAFRKKFLEEESHKYKAINTEQEASVAMAIAQLAYNVILRCFYKWDIPLVENSIHESIDEDTGLRKYLQMKLDARYVEVKQLDKNIELPDSYTVQRATDLEELSKTFPLESFRFEGLVVVEVSDVTAEQSITEIKNTLLNINAFADVTVYDALQEHVQTFLGVKDVQVGITPFFRINNYFLFAELHYRNSLLFRNTKALAHRLRTTRLVQKAFKKTAQPQLHPTVEETTDNALLQFYAEQGLQSLLLCPLKGDDGELIGLLEIGSPHPGRLRYQHLSKIASAMQLFTLTLEKSMESLELQVDKTIKEHFTAIQPAVEWKFTEAAFEFLEHRQKDESAKLPAIAFENVYPLYAAIDVKNSSLERNKSIQQDLLEQLQMVRDVLDKAVTGVQFPLLKELQFKVDKFMASTAENLLSENEMMIYEFLQHNIDGLFHHLQESRPELQETVEDYFQALDPEKKILYRHRKQYEDSITKINDVLDRLIDREQASIQHIYPHYFERYLTDGVDFNIYIGQSLAPHLPFDELYVSNLKMWQLMLMVKATRVSNSLEKKLPLSLQTTQLILAHSIPLTISFRNKERKFDVDGAYNIRYEMVKKRIDKVHLRDSEERLVQPGMVAIVYSQQKEMAEYQEYIEFLQHEGHIEGEVEHLELEELQGVSGLKALRFGVKLATENTNGKAEAGKLPTAQLLRK